MVPNFTFFATASMVMMSGAVPILCEIDPETWLIDLEDAKSKITPKTKAIAPVHLFGNVISVDDVREMADHYNLYVIWDAAQAHGAEYDGLDIGAIEDIVCYSFYPSKNMFTGEGGMITFNNESWFEKLTYLRSHGQTGKYYHTMLGLNYRMTDIEAAIGLAQLKRLDKMLKIRRKNAEMLIDGLTDISGITVQKVLQGCKHAYHQFCVRVDKENFGIDRDTLSEQLKKEGIATGIHYPRGIHQQPVFENTYGPMRFPVAEKLCKEILAIPVHHGLLPSDVNYIIDSIHEISSKA